MTKKKLPAEHPQKRQAKRKPRAPKIVNTPDNRGVCVDFYNNTWATTHQFSRFHERRDAAAPPKLVWTVAWADRLARWLNAIDHALRGTRITLATRIHAIARWVHPYGY